ncbi:MAG: hypothetical protein IIZ63_09675 [Caulobacteraceae bacterium]|nr:hypothetical protein [Caulobacteraceae bacterium]
MLQSPPPPPPPPEPEPEPEPVAAPASSASLTSSPAPIVGLSLAASGVIRGLPWTGRNVVRGGGFAGAAFGGVEVLTGTLAGAFAAVLAGALTGAGGAGIGAGGAGGLGGATNCTTIGSGTKAVGRSVQGESSASNTNAWQTPLRATVTALRRPPERRRAEAAGPAGPGDAGTEGAPRLWT